MKGSPKRESVSEGRNHRWRSLAHALTPRAVTALTKVIAERLRRGARRANATTSPRFFIAGPGLAQLASRLSWKATLPQIAIVDTFRRRSGPLENYQPDDLVGVLWNLY